MYFPQDDELNICHCLKCDVIDSGGSWHRKFWRWFIDGVSSPLPAEPSTELLSFCSFAPFASFWYNVKNRVGPKSEILHESVDFLYIYMNNLGVFKKGTHISIISSPFPFRILVVGAMWREVVDIHILKKKKSPRWYGSPLASTLESLIYFKAFILVL